MIKQNFERNLQDIDISVEHLFVCTKYTARPFETAIQVINSSNCS